MKPKRDLRIKGHTALACSYSGTAAGMDAFTLEFWSATKKNQKTSKNRTSICSDFIRSTSFTINH